jgi:hypothetical protein
MNMRFGSVTMMAATAAAILGFNTLSLHVSAERGKVEKLERRIAADLRDIRALEAELRTRARLPVLQTWNDNVLAMSAPTAKQFADDPVQLAAFAPGAAAVAPGAPTVQMALATPESTTLPKPGLVKAAYTVPTAPALRAEAVIDLTGERAATSKAAAPKPVVKAEVKTSAPKKAEAKPVQLAAVKPKLAPKADSLDALIGAIDSAAATQGGLQKVSMQ